MQHFQGDEPPDECEDIVRPAYCYYIYDESDPDLKLEDESSMLDLGAFQETPVAVIVICLSVLGILAIILFTFLYLYFKRFFFPQPKSTYEQPQSLEVDQPQTEQQRIQRSHITPASQTTHFDQPHSVPHRSRLHLHRSQSTPEIRSQSVMSSTSNSIYGFKTIVEPARSSEKLDHSKKGRGIVLSRKKSSFYGSKSSKPIESDIRSTVASETHVPFASRREVISLKNRSFIDSTMRNREK